MSKLVLLAKYQETHRGKKVSITLVVFEPLLST